MQCPGHDMSICALLRSKVRCKGECLSVCASTSEIRICFFLLHWRGFSKTLSSLKKKKKLHIWGEILIYKRGWLIPWNINNKESRPVITLRQVKHGSRLESIVETFFFFFFLNHFFSSNLKGNYSNMSLFWRHFRETTYTKVCIKHPAWFSPVFLLRDIVLWPDMISVADYFKIVQLCQFLHYHVSFPCWVWVSGQLHLVL